MLRMSTWMLAALAGCIGTCGHAETECADLRRLKLRDTVITGAQLHAGGAEQFVVRGPPGVAIPPLTAQLPTYCRVTASIRPTRDSDIRFELWLPQQNWNHRYQQVGNGGLAGAIPITSLIEPLQSGWAVAGTDDGHVGADMADGRWALGHPEKIVDYGHRAVHLTAQRAQAIIASYYRARAAHAYFVGCSDGGRESLMEAQRYPDDFDGFVAGAPAVDTLSLQIGGAFRAQTAQALGDMRLNPAQAALVRDRALAECDGLDGVRDGVIAEPRRCTFKPQSLLCQPAATASCLSAVQVSALQQIVGDAHAAGSDKRLAFGMADTVGTAAAANVLLAGSTANPLAAQVFGNLLYGRPDIELLNLDLEKTSQDAAAGLAGVLNPSSAELQRVRRAGKKIIQYHGWWDPLIPAASSLDYFGRVQRALGDTQDFYRLFMVPGMGHCGGGVGASWIMGAGVQHDAEHDAVAALTRWVEQGVAPDRIIATEFSSEALDPISGPAPGTPVKSTRPVCAYPKTALYAGAGDTADAGNFSCQRTLPAASSSAAGELGP